MNLIRALVAVAAISTITVAGSAHAAISTQFLQHAPIAKFNYEDTDLMVGTIEKSLNEATDGKSTQWKSDKTPAKGTVTPVKTFEKDGLKCRQTRITNRYKTLKGSSTVVLCQQPNGDWKAY